MMTGTHSEATRRKLSAAQSGENHWHAKLTAAQVRKIYALKGKVPARRVAARFKNIVAKSTIQSIWQGKLWSTVTGAPRKGGPSWR